MNPERHQRIMDILGQALERNGKGDEEWLSEICAGDEALHADVARLLVRQKQAEQFLEESPLAAAAGKPDSNGRLIIGERIGLYKIISEIGRGGMGAVYLAERDDEQFTRRVALKLIKRGMDTDFVVRRFRHERQILASLDHPNIGGLIDGGATKADLPYFIMEYVEGQPITEYANEHSLTTTERLKLFRTVCSAVQYAHQNLVIHRDLKPSNILVTKEGEPKLLDFGIAKLLQADGGAETELTATAVRVMTPEYASPEQVKGQRITTASDVYSLGVLLYELLTGQRPYRVKSRQPEEIARAICEQEPEKPSQVVSGQWSMISGQKQSGGQQLSSGPTVREGSVATPGSTIINPKLLRGDLDNIVLKALRKEPQRRYLSVEQFSEDIRRHLEGLPVTARQATVSYRTSKFIQRNKIAVTAAAIVILTLIGGIIGTAWGAHKARVQSARAEQRFNEVRKLAHSVLFDYHDAIAALPGSTAVRQRLVKDALEYLDHLSKDASNDTTLLREIAAAYEKVSMVQGGYALSSRGNVLATSNLGDTRGAIENLNKALAIRNRVFALEPNNKDVRQELALCYERIALIYVYNGPPDKAVDNLRKATPMLEALAAADPTNEDLQYALVDNYQGMAKALGNPTSPNLGDTQGALEYMGKAQPIIEKLAADHPTNLAYQLFLAGLHNSRGWVLNASGKLPEALDQARQALAIYRELVKADPGNTLYRTQLANQLSANGRIMLNAGDNRGALQDFKEGKAIYEAALAADPHDTYSRRGVALGYRNVAEALGAMRDYAGALNSFHQAQQLFAELVAKDPANASLQAQVYLVMSRVQSQAGDLNGAMDSALEGIRIDEALLSTSPTNAFARNTLAQLYEAMGSCNAKLAAKAGTLNVKQNEQWRAAKDAYQKSLDIYQDMKSKSTLSGADAGKPDELAKEIANCDAALKAGSK